MQITDSDTPTMLWHLANGRTVRCPLADFTSPTKVQQHIFRACAGVETFVPVPALCSAVWGGKIASKTCENEYDGLAARLNDVAEIIPEDFSPHLVFLLDLRQTLHAAIGEPLEFADREGLPVHVEGKGIAFKWTAVLDQVKGGNPSLCRTTQSETKRLRLLVSDYCDSPAIKLPHADGTRSTLMLMSVEGYERFAEFVDRL